VPDGGTVPNLKHGDIARLERRLRRSRDALRHDIGEAMADTGREDLTEIVGRVRDPGEDSVAELVASINLTMLDRAVNELRDVEAALRCIGEGSYGRCQDCGGDIERERLASYPTARRCVDCQRRFEIQRAGGRDQSPSL
jgi:DnaK suppressor protein